MESATESSMAFPQVSPDSMEDAPASHDGNEKKRKALGPREARGESVEEHRRYDTNKSEPPCSLLMRGG